MVSTTRVIEFPKSSGDILGAVVENRSIGFADIGWLALRAELDLCLHIVVAGEVRFNFSFFRLVVEKQVVVGNGEWIAHGLFPFKKLTPFKDR